MATHFVCRINVANDSPKPIQLWIEPWADEFIVEPATELTVEFDGPQKGEVGVSYVESGIQLFGFRGSSATVIKSGTVIWRAHQRLPL
jgi:hypothetical protein